MQSYDNGRKFKFIIKWFGLITFSNVLFFAACTAPTSQPKSQTTIESVEVTSVFDKKKMNNKIDFFLNELSKKHTIQQDSSSNTKFKNYNYSKAISLKNKDQKNRIQFQFYGFSKTVLCDTANHKFLKNLGDVTKVKPGKNLRYIKSSPWFIIKNEDHIILMQYECENNLADDKIAHLKQLLKQQFATPKSEIVNVECGGPLEWL